MIGENLMTSLHRTVIWAAALAGAFAGLPGPASAQNILDEWPSIKAPPPPQIKPVTLDVSKTALIVMDFNQRNCVPQQRARCAAVLPAVQKLLAQARGKGMPVVHTYTPNMDKSDIVKEVASAE